MKRSLCFRLLVALGWATCFFGAAFSQELPVLVPTAQAGATPTAIPMTFEAFHSATATEDGKGLRLDLGDSSLQGTFHFGIFPFAEGDADLAYTRFAGSGSVTGGTCDINVSGLLAASKNVNGWPEGRGLFPPTMTVTVRMVLQRATDGKTAYFGPVDGRFSFRLTGTANTVQPNLTIVEGPLINLKESGDPSRVTVSWRTDAAATAKVRIVPASNPYRTASGDLRDPFLQAGREFTAGPAQYNKVAVTGLAPSTRYLYLVESQAPDGTVARSPIHSFSTAPRPGQGEVTFMAISDSPQAAGGGEMSAMGINRQSTGQLAFQAARNEADLVLFSGDLVEGASTDQADYRYQLQGWKDAWSPFWDSRPIYAIPGNHEILMNFYQDGTSMDRWPYAQESSEAVFADEIVMPTNGPIPADSRRPPYRGTAYSFQYGPVLFVGLNNAYWTTSGPSGDITPLYGGCPAGYLMDDQLRWFEDVMASAQRSPTVRFVVVFMHEPAFPCGPAGGGDVGGLWWDGNNNTRAYVRQGATVVPDGEGVIDVRNRFWSVLANNAKTAALVTAHQHNYSRLLVDQRTPVGVMPGDDTNHDGILDQFSPNPAFRLPVWQIVAGNGGANYAAVSTAGMPWTPTVVSNQEGFCILKTRGDALSLTAYSMAGQVLDHVDDLMAVKRRMR